MHGVYDAIAIAIAYYVSSLKTLYMYLFWAEVVVT